MIDIVVGPNLVEFGNFVMSWHGFFSFIAVSSSVYLVARWAPMSGIDPDDIYSLAVWCIIGGIIGARAVHVIDHWGDPYTFSDPVRMIAIWSGGIGVWGGILGGLAGGVLGARRLELPVGTVADLVAPVLLFAQTVGRLGDIVNGEHCAKAWDFALGFVWTNPDSTARMCGPINGNGVGVSVHPIIAYEMIWNMLALVVVWRLWGKLQPPGMVYVLYLTLYSVGRFWITFLRDDKIMAIGLQEAQFISMIVLAIAVPLLIIKARFVSGSRLLAVDFQAPLSVSERRTRAQRRRKRRR